MATASLVPVSETDVDSNIQSGAFTDIDNTIAAAQDGALLIGNNNNWTNQLDNTQNGEIVFGLTNAPGDFGTFNSIIFTVRAQVTGGVNGDTMTWRGAINGTNAPAAVVAWDDTDDGGGFSNRSIPTDSGISPSAADIDGWTFNIYQFLYNQDMGPDGVQWEISEIECILDYDVSVAAGHGLLLSEQRNKAIL